MTRNGPGYQDLRGTAPRMFVAPHVAEYPGQPSAFVQPAIALQLGETTLGDDKETYHPQITIFALQSRNALTFLPNPDEMEALAEGLSKMAAKMRERADAQLADVLKRGPTEERKA